MQSAEESLIKLATELTERVAYLENVNSTLYQNLCNAQSVIAKSAKYSNSASTGTVEATVQALHKAGAVEADQVEASRQKMLSDANAVHRVLQRVLSLEAGQQKSASLQKAQATLAGGRIVSNDTKTDAQADCMQRMINLLNI